LCIDLRIPVGAARRAGPTRGGARPPNRDRGAAWNSGDCGGASGSSAAVKMAAKPNSRRILRILRINPKSNAPAKTAAGPNLLAPSGRPTILGGQSLTHFTGGGP